MYNLLKHLLKRYLPQPVRKAIRHYILGKRTPVRRKGRHTRPQTGSPSTTFATIAYTEHGGYIVPMACVRDEACQAILNGQLYEPETLEIMSQMSRFGAIVHAGAFFGDFLPTLAKDADPESRIFAFEPNPASYRCAKATIYLNGLEQRIELIRAGLGAEKGTAMLKTVDRSLVPLGGQAHVVDVESADDASPVTCRNDVDSEDGSIEIVTLDEFLPADCRIGVLQLDLEGHETRALQRGLQMIARDRPCLILETPPDQAWFDRHLGALGYRQQRRVHRNTVYVVGPF